ncbi:3-oxoacyl-ACP reductase FabG [Asanoa sp. WMMD1127]|uniref:SDR family NAD(P)-dependent oxidoreductase n=1 Tax=Asanoa sp. WMMD1127 TaxID=3016107 RepID=UPI002415B17B|nr:3-oxoacyl-ACP reductase family protein [Asanoa sp. WMMD1127]MDG4820754.1 3-oxoacyl-ACP reductase FabG [Asanoa sp. WMMD1127]
MTLQLNGKRALVTGGTRGIGRAVVTALAGAGARVITCSRSGGEAAESLARELKETGGDHHVMKADVAQPDDIDRLVGEAETRFGGLDVIVHNAGVISHVPFGELPEDEWHRVIDTNLTAAYLIVRRALPLLDTGASVIHIGSKVAMVGVPLRAHYTAAKAGLIGLTRSMSKELGPRGIRVNVLAPGPVETETAVPAEVVARYQKMIPLGRLGRAPEIANAVLFLASDLASFVNGETLNVDGGI